MIVRSLRKHNLFTYMKNCLFILVLLFCGGLKCVSQIEAKKEHEKWRFSISGGPGYMYSSSKEAENNLVASGIDRHKAKSYYKDYKWGWQGNADLHYLLGRHIGIGAKYSFFSTSGKLKDVSLGNYNGDGLHIFFGDLKEQLYVNYIGPSILGQTFVNTRKTWKATALISLGYANYRSETHILEVPALITSNNFGGYSELGMEYYLSKHIAIGANLNYFAASFKKMNVKNNQGSQEIDLNERENVSRLDLSFGIRINY